MAMIYYGERTQCETAEERGTQDEVWGEPGTWCRVSSPSGVSQDVRISSSNVNCGHAGKLTGDSVPRVFTGCTFHRHPLPAVQQCSRLPEGKRVFSVNHNVCTNSLSHSSWFWEWWGSVPPEICLPRCQPKANFASHSFKGFQPGLFCPLSSSCIVIHSFIHSVFVLIRLGCYNKNSSHWIVYKQ